MSDKVGFHSTVMTPNGPGIVQGLLKKDDKESILISHQPGQFNPEVAQDGEAISKVPSVWMLFAYPPEMISPKPRGA